MDNAQHTEGVATPAAPTEETKPAIQAISVPNSRAEGTRIVAKDTASGRFVSNKKLSRNQRAKQDIQKFLAREVRPGMSRDLEMIEHMYKVAMTCTAEEAVGLAKLFEEIQLRGRGKAEETEETQAHHALNPVKIVIIPPMELMHAESVEEKPREVLRPSFILDAEFITNGKE